MHVDVDIPTHLSVFRLGSLLIEFLLLNKEGREELYLSHRHRHRHTHTHTHTHTHLQATVKLL